MTLLNPPNEPREIISLGSLQLGFSLTDRAVERMLLHMRMVQEWNIRVDLTSLTDASEMAIRHFLDSLTLLKVLSHLDGARVLDIGTGAGFPGLVLGSAIESFDLILLDRDPAKIVFLKYAVKKLARARVRFLNMAIGPVVQERAIDPCDVVISRAFSSDAALMDSFHVLLKDGGFLARMTGPASADERFMLEHFEIADTWEGNLPFSRRFRRVILYRRLHDSES